MTEVHELVRFQRELKEEEHLIVSMLSKIDVQLHALQVEQLQLLSTKICAKGGSSMPQNLPTNERKSTDTNVKKELDLDLAVPHVRQESETDEEDDSS